MKAKTKVRFLNLNILSLTQKELLEQMAEGVLYTENFMTSTSKRNG